MKPFFWSKLNKHARMGKTTLQSHSLPCKTYEPFLEKALLLRTNTSEQAPWILKLVGWASCIFIAPHFSSNAVNVRLQCKFCGITWRSISNNRLSHYSSRCQFTCLNEYWLQTMGTTGHTWLESRQWKRAAFKRQRPASPRLRVAFLETSKIDKPVLFILATLLVYRRYRLFFPVITVDLKYCHWPVKAPKKGIHLSLDFSDSNNALFGNDEPPR